MSNEACEMTEYYLRKIPSEKNKCSDIKKALELCNSNGLSHCELIKKDFDFCTANVKRMEEVLTESKIKCNLYNRLSR
ncbi:putative orfan [Tupanvirus soda lake]|uniref:Orfan n=2 Tax=Tupanvirus TaxID=2094720 RepID=A0AC62AB26_9VIRU|nr:putative orfan [Tupanvirus soda lake]QKU34987.1 putative orfan [Tupanvirus soda lake]